MNNSLKARVMTRIYLEYTKNIFFQYLDYFMFLLFIAVSLTVISVRNVLENIPKDNLVSMLNFFLVAIRNTSFIIQALIVGFFVRVSAVSLLSTYRNYRNMRSLDVVRWISRYSRLNSNTEKGSL